MKRSLLCTLFVLTTSALAAATPALPLLELSYAECAHIGPASICVVPGGGGTPLSQAFDLSGTPGTRVDATIHVYLYTYGYQPIYSFPGEDVWLESEAGGLVPCRLGTISDGSSDIEGHLTFSGPLEGGGASAADEPLRVLISGAMLHQSQNIRVNSPDMNGDLRVDLTDVVLFSELFLDGDYHLSLIHI